MKKKILLIRLDKIGDLICTMCVDQASFLSDYELYWVIAKGLGFVPTHASPRRKFLELSKNETSQSLQKLREFLREYKPDVAVSFQAPWWVHFALWSENVPVRAGVLSQWHSFLFLNKGLRQKRSKAVQHEADYNFDLLKYALSIAEPAKSEATPVLKFVAEENPALIDKYHLIKKSYVIVHPGMAGSALNWPIENYMELISRLIPKTTVVLTGTAGDEFWLKDIKEKFKNDEHVLCLQSLLSSSELMTVLEHAKAVVVPSTGVAHIAASLGVPVLGIYSPIRVQHPRRWAARGDKVHIFMAPHKENEPIVPNCMSQITVDEIMKALNVL